MITASQVESMRRTMHRLVDSAMSVSSAEERETAHREIDELCDLALAELARRQ